MQHLSKWVFSNRLLFLFLQVTENINGDEFWWVLDEWGPLGQIRKAE